MMTTRVEGWEVLLDDLITDALLKPYVLGEHDCFRLACSVVQMLTGVNRWPEFAGKYKTRKQAERLLAVHGSTFELAGDWFFGSAHLPASQATRGDICCVETEDKAKHLGICIGKYNALLGPEGLVFLPTLDARCAWRIGD
jgi:hypothetical protein